MLDSKYTDNNERIRAGEVFGALDRFNEVVAKPRDDAKKGKRDDFFAVTMNIVRVLCHAF